MNSYGLTVWDGGSATFHVSSDATFDTESIAEVAEDVSVIFHDCEVGYRTGVHAHYDELLTLPPEVRAKMWLYHYNPTEAAKKDAVADGFLGFVQRGQTFTFE